MGEKTTLCGTPDVMWILNNVPAHLQASHCYSHNRYFYKAYQYLESQLQYHNCNIHQSSTNTGYADDLGIIARDIHLSIVG